MSFFYTYFGDYMKIYLDIVFIINFTFDFLLLMSVSIILRRNVSIWRLILGSFIGSITIFILFLKINSLQLFFIKFVISILMNVITFKFINIRYTIKNVTFLYIASTILGGFLYMINNQFSYKQEGLIFYHDGLSINFITIFFLSPIIIYLYIKQIKNIKNNFSNYYKVDLYLKNNCVLRFNAFLDTGNKLMEPITKKPIILINRKDLIYDINEFKMFLVPYNTISENGLLTCIKVNKIIIDGIGERKNFLLGLTDNVIKINGINCILNSKLLEG